MKPIWMGAAAALLTLLGCDRTYLPERAPEPATYPAPDEEPDDEPADEGGTTPG